MPLFVACEITAIDGRRRSVKVEHVLVHPYRGYTCIDAGTLTDLGVAVRKDVALISADGIQIVRRIGFVILRAHGFETVDEVVFGEADDIRFLGSRTLVGFGAKVEPGKKRLIAAGPISAAGSKIEDWR